MRKPIKRMKADTEKIQAILFNDGTIKYCIVFYKSGINRSYHDEKKIKEWKKRSEWWHIRYDSNWMTDIERNFFGNPKRKILTPRMRNEVPEKAKGLCELYDTIAK